MACSVIVTVNRFWTGLPLRAKALALVWVPLPILFVAGIVMYRAELGERQGRVSIEQAWDVRASIQEVMILLQDAEASARDFAVRGDEEALGPFLPSRELFPVVSARVDTLVRNEPEQCARWKEIENLINLELERLDKVCKSASGLGP